MSNPITPLRLFRSPNRTAGYLNLMIVAGPMFAVNFFVTQFLQNVRGYDALTAGLTFLPQMAALMVAATVTGKLVPKIGVRPVVLGGLVSLVLGMIWLAQLSPDSTFLGGILGPMILLGIGPGAAMTACNVAILHGVSEQSSGAASSLLEATQWVGGTIGLSILVTVFGAATRGSTADSNTALVDGMSVAFLSALVLLVIGVIVTVLMISGKIGATEPEAEAAKDFQPAAPGQEQG